MTRKMPIVALVPVRGFAQGKQRLAPTLASRDRHALVRAMLEDVLEALRGARGIAVSLVVSGDAEVLPVAEAAGAMLLPDVPDGGLNGSLQAASAWVAAAFPAHALLVVVADLPVLTPALLASTVLASTADVVIVRSVDGGTNLLLQRPPPAICFAFGRESCARHRQAALTAGRTVAVIEHPVLERDFDTPDDLTALLPLPATGRTIRLLQHLRLSKPGAARREVTATRGA